MRLVIVTLSLLILGVGGWLYGIDQRNRLVWDHFDVVKPGILYRSGQLEPDQLRDALARYRVKTLVNFQYPGAKVEAERAIAQSLGVAFKNLPMPGNGAGREDQFREVLEACSDPSQRPVWIHCARGTCRTGASVALYRFERDGWTVADVAAEMRRQAYWDGWLPGYVFGMVKERPFYECVVPVSDDRRPGQENPPD